MEPHTSRRTFVVTLSSLFTGWQAHAAGRDPSSIVVHGAGPTGTVARIAVQLNFQKPETWIYEMAGRSVGLGGAQALLQDGIRNARKRIHDGFVLLRTSGEATSASRIDFSHHGIATLADIPPGSYAAVIEVPSRHMRLGGRFRATAEGFINEAKLEVL